MDLNIQVTNFPLGSNISKEASSEPSSMWYMYHLGKYVGTFSCNPDNNTINVDIEFVGEGRDLPLEVAVTWIENWIRYYSSFGQNTRILENILARMFTTVSEMLEREHNPEMRQIINEEMQKIQSLRENFLG